MGSGNRGCYPPAEGRQGGRLREAFEMTPLEMFLGGRWIAEMDSTGLKMGAGVASVYMEMYFNAVSRRLLRDYLCRKMLKVFTSRSQVIWATRLQSCSQISVFTDFCMKVWSIRFRLTF